MVIILAGNECTGKSTIFNQLKKEYLPENTSFIKESHTSDIFMKQMRAMYLAERCEVKCLTIYDRATVLDDLVYSQVMDEKPYSNAKAKVHGLLSKCHIIYLDCDIEVLKERLRKRGDEYIEENQLKEIQRCYEGVFKKYRLDPIHIDTTGMSFGEVYDKVMEVVKECLKSLE